MLNDQSTISIKRQGKHTNNHKAPRGNKTKSTQTTTDDQYVDKKSIG